jgi:chromosome segregation ATPase
MQKLDEMEQDLTFLRDEIAVSQAAAVAKAQTLMVQMQNQALARLQEGAAVLAAKDQELQALSSKLRSTSEALAEQTSQVDRQASDMTDLKQHLASISKQAADYTDDVQRLSSKILNASEALSEQTSQVDRQASDITDRKKQLEDGEQKTVKSGEGGGEALREELSSLEAKLKVLRSSSDSVQQQLMQEIDMLKKRLEEVAKNLQPVELIMTLGLDFSVAGSDGSVKREKFQCDVAQDLASASGLPPANFRIHFGIKDGSIILDVQVMPDPLAPGKHREAAKYWAQQAVDISSKLRSGKITSHATGVEVRPSKEEEREKALSELRVQRDEAKRAHAQLANQVDFLTEQLKSVSKLEAEVERLKAELDASTGELQVVTEEHVKSQRACVDIRKMLEDKEAVHAKV